MVRSSGPERYFRARRLLRWSPERAGMGRRNDLSVLLAPQQASRPRGRFSRDDVGGPGVREQDHAEGVGGEVPTRREEQGHAGAGPTRPEESGLQHAEIHAPGERGASHRVATRFPTGSPYRESVQEQWRTRGTAGFAVVRCKASGPMSERSVLTCPFPVFNQKNPVALHMPRWPRVTRYSRCPSRSIASILPYRAIWCASR